jgi:hypothetical protein
VYDIGEAKRLSSGRRLRSNERLLKSRGLTVVGIKLAVVVIILSVDTDVTMSVKFLVSVVDVQYVIVVGALLSVIVT